ncbi:ATP-binding protein [Marispirochaeta sp.]|jgi:signal transduction histidine kinase|uniref:sensor histidine kinase n=1 Tax=Marispirochaeta sp. TaxID=2038653 RepID=UPI0029C8802B|nr:ATP-binding protein [Marispirochaeta sp.]
MAGKKPAKRLIEGTQLLSLLISIITIFIVQIVSIFAISVFIILDLNEKAENAADETVYILTEPLYNVDDSQIVRIADALLSSGRISGIVIDTSATGIVVDKPAPVQSRWIRPRIREVNHNDFFLGTIELQFSDDELLATIKRFLFTMVVAVIAILWVYLITTRVFIQKRTKRIFAALSIGINEIAAGNYAYNIQKTNYEDIDAIINLLNDMTRRIQGKNAELVEMNASLEQRVAERTAELEESLAELQRMQERLIESGKLSALGQLSAGIAHELNTPLGAIISAVSSMVTSFDKKLPEQPVFISSLSKKERDLYMKAVATGIETNKTLDIYLPSRRKTKGAEELLQQKKIPNSHEVTVLLADMGLLNNLDDLLPYLAIKKNKEILAEVSDTVIIRRMIEIIYESSKKASNVIEALRSYLTTTVSDETNVIDVETDIKKVLTLMHNLLKHGIKVKTEFSGLYVLARADTLSNVWMNLIRNAVQALNGSGEILIKTEKLDGRGIISIKDNGPGVSPEIQHRIFEPFFTTKNDIQGMGLGLDICRRIIESSQGKIWVQSVPGETVFFVSLPLAK